MGNSRVLLLGSLIIVILLNIVWNESYLVKADSDVIANDEDIKNEEQLKLDCQDPDYRTYIKCLKYPNYKGNKVKRHNPYEMAAEIDHACMDTCVKKNCGQMATHDCSSKCSHCIKRKRTRTQIITEYETECIEGDCSKPSDKQSPPSLGTTNITTNIDIKNIINPVTERPGDMTTKPPITIIPPHPHPHPPYPHPHPPTDCNCTTDANCPCRPHIPPWHDHWHPQPSFSGGLQLSLVPQLTLGLGLSPSFGCYYPYHWFCNNYNHHDVHYNHHEIDCSECHHSYNRYKCHSSCYGYDSHGYRRKREDEPCKGPHCIGGI